MLVYSTKTSVDFPDTMSTVALSSTVPCLLQLVVPQKGYKNEQSPVKELARRLFCPIIYRQLTINPEFCSPCKFCH